MSRRGEPSRPASDLQLAADTLLLELGTRAPRISGVSRATLCAIAQGARILPSTAERARSAFERLGWSSELLKFDRPLTPSVAGAPRLRIVRSEVRGAK